jgi:polyferredoxin
LFSSSDMFEGQLITGLLISLACIAVHSVFMAVVNGTATNTSRLLEARPANLRVVLIMAATVTALLAAHVIEVAIWGLAYALLQAAPKRVDAFYFAFVNYTTLGYGDILPEPRWRLLGPIAAMNGVLLFGWSTAVIYDVLRNVAQKPHAHVNRPS